MKAMRGPRMDPAWTPHGPVGGAPEMDYTGEAMRGPGMDPWGGAPEMGCVVKAMRGPRMDPAWTHGVAPNGPETAPNGPETAPNGPENGRNRSISPNTYKIGQFEAF
jgi:hypothetical protein